VSQLERAFKVLEHLHRTGGSSFGELLFLLEPISPTTLSKLLQELIRLGKVRRDARQYHISQQQVSRGDLRAYQLPDAVRQRSQAVLEETAKKSGHACALFARVGGTTMKIVDQYNLEKPHWSFSPIGYEWPLVPFHGFAKVFLAHMDLEHARTCYRMWERFLKPELLAANWERFAQQLAMIRQRGYALEYQEELSTILRLVVPVSLAGSNDIRFAVGLVARSVYLLEVDACLQILQQCAVKLSSELQVQR
jgi:DNA-binding IclR family transcriptional regulator